MKRLLHVTAWDLQRDPAPGAWATRAFLAAPVPLGQADQAVLSASCVGVTVSWPGLREG